MSLTFAFSYCPIEKHNEPILLVISGGTSTSSVFSKNSEAFVYASSDACKFILVYNIAFQLLQKANVNLRS